MPVLLLQPPRKKNESTTQFAPSTASSFLSPASSSSSSAAAATASTDASAQSLSSVTSTHTNFRSRDEETEKDEGAHAHARAAIARGTDRAVEKEETGSEAVASSLRFHAPAAGQRRHHHQQQQIPGETEQQHAEQQPLSGKFALKLRGICAAYPDVVLSSDSEFDSVSDSDSVEFEEREHDGQGNGGAFEALETNAQAAAAAAGGGGSSANTFMRATSILRRQSCLGNNINDNNNSKKNNATTNTTAARADSTATRGRGRGRGHSRGRRGVPAGGGAGRSRGHEAVRARCSAAPAPPLVTIRRLGRGSSGVVEQALIMDTLHIVALKRVPLVSRTHDHLAELRLCNEIDALKLNGGPLAATTTAAAGPPPPPPATTPTSSRQQQQQQPSCPHLLKFWGAFWDDNGFGVTLMTEFVGGGDLQQVLARSRSPNPPPPPPPAPRRRGGRTRAADSTTSLEPAVMAELFAALAGGVGRALEFLHNNGVAHCDVKPQNILVGRNGAVKLADLGSCVFFHRATRSAGSTTTTTTAVAAAAAAAAPSTTTAPTTTNVADPASAPRTIVAGGTLLYMPPDRLAGMTRAGPSAAADATSAPECLMAGDVWAVGMVLLVVCARFVIPEQSSTPPRAPQADDQLQQAHGLRLKHYFSGVAQHSCGGDSVSAAASFDAWSVQEFICTELPQIMLAVRDALVSVGTVVAGDRKARPSSVGEVLVECLEQCLRPSAKSRIKLAALLLACSAVGASGNSEKSCAAVRTALAAVRGVCPRDKAAGRQRVVETVRKVTVARQRKEAKSKSKSSSTTTGPGLSKGSVITAGRQTRRRGEHQKNQSKAMSLAKDLGAHDRDSVRRLLQLL